MGLNLYQILTSDINKKSRKLGKAFSLPPLTPRLSGIVSEPLSHKNIFKTVVNALDKPLVHYRTYETDEEDQDFDPNDSF